MADEKKIKLKIMRAFWPDEDRRVDEGEEIDVSMDDALRLIEAGIASRVEAKPAAKAN